MTDLLVVNASVRTMDPDRPTATSVACTGGLVESIDETPDAKRTFDAKGSAIVPGFAAGPLPLTAGGLMDLQRTAIPAGVTALHAVVDDEALRELISVSDGRALRLRVRATLSSGAEAPLKSHGRLLVGGTAYTYAGKADGLDPRARFNELGGGEGALKEMCVRAAVGTSEKAGMLAVGERADMAVLSRDWVGASPEEVAASEVLATLMDGRVACLSPKLRG